MNQLLSVVWKPGNWTDTFSFSERITEMLKLEWTSWDHLVQPSQLRLSQLEQVAQDHVQMAF